MKYKVLWLDDDFETSKMKPTYDSFINNQKKGLFGEFEVTTCRNYDEFIKYFESDVYQAVILDVIGFKDEKDISGTDYPFHSALRYLEDKDVVVKVYTGDPNKSVTTNGSALRIMEDKGWKEDKDFFFKNKDYFTLFQVLTEELKQKMYLYKDREYLIDMFTPTKQYLNNIDQMRIKTVLEAKIIAGNNYREYRDLLQNILTKLVYMDEDSKEPYQFIPNKHVNIEVQNKLFGRLCKWFWKNDEGSNARTIFENNYKDSATKEDLLQISLIINAIQNAYNFGNALGGHGEDYSTCRDFDFPDYVKAASSSMLTILSWYYNHREKYYE